MADVNPAGGGVRDVLIGRDAELARLTDLVRETVAGSGSAAVVLGDAGMGKTRLLRELTRVAVAEGGRVAWGHAWADEGAPPLWPWTQVLRAAVSGPGASGRRVDAGPGASVLADAVPGIADHLLPFSPLEAPPAHAEFYLRDAVTRLLTGLATDGPLFVLLDDLHWADVASLRLARHLVDHLGPVPLAVVASSRVAEAPSLVDELSASAVTVVLDALSRDDCRRWADLAVEDTLGSSEVVSMHEATGGVPLFFDTALRQRGSPVVVGHGLEPVTDVSAECRAMLQAASVLGRSFDVAALAAVVGAAPSSVRSVLAEAVRAGTVQSAPTAAGAGETPPPSSAFEFRHALVAREFYEDLDPMRRSELHLACAELVAAGRTGWDEVRRLTERARHLLAALPAGDATTAARAAADAARAASARHAHDDAAAWYERAASVHPVDDGERCDLLIARNQSLLHGSGVAEAADGFAAVAALADGLGDRRRHLTALVGLTEARYRAPGLDVDDHTRLLLTRAADAVGDDPQLQAAAAEQLARLETFNGETARALAYATAAADAADVAADPVASVIAARAVRWATVGPTSLSAKRAASAALLMTDADLHPEMRWDAHQWMMLDAMEAGDRKAMDAEFAACRRVADELGEPFVTSLTHVWDAGLAMMQGRFDDADAAIATALGLMESSGVDPAGVYSQMAVLARDRGDLDGLDELLAGVADAVPEGSTTYRSALALVYAEQGRDELARAELDRIGAGGFDRLGVNGVWLTAMALCAEACSVLEHDSVAAEILPLLVDYADRGVVAGGGPYLYLGAVTHHLGSLSTTAGDPDAALRWLDDAATVHQRLGAEAWTVRTGYERGRALLRIGGRSSGDGRRLLREAASTAHRLGMTTLAGRARAAGEETSQGAGVFAPVGDRWRIEFHAASFALPDSKGLRCLHHLLRHPGRAVGAADLVADALDEQVTSAERARVNVTRQIRTAIRRIGDHDADLAQHLATSVHTGHECSYKPVVAVPDWTLEVQSGS